MSLRKSKAKWERHFLKLEGFSLSIKAKEVNEISLFADLVTIYADH